VIISDSTGCVGIGIDGPDLRIYAQHRKRNNKEYGAGRIISEVGLFVVSFLNVQRDLGFRDELRGKSSWNWRFRG
jgi:hypothetical protein